MLNRNFFPQYGRIAIIDDHKEEVEGLMTLLYENAIPFIYLENVPEDFGKLNCDGFRIVFLDLVLSGASDEKSVESILYANLKGLLKENNGPCTIAIWSTQVERYKEQLDKVISDINCGLCETIYLDKSKYKNYNQALAEDFENHFFEAFKNSTLLHFISLWENTINHTMNDVVYKFNSSLPHSRKDRGGHFASNLARLALDERIGEASNEQRLFAAYEGINTLLNKASNLKITNLVDLSKSIIDVPSPDPQLKDIDINTLLWISEQYTFFSPKNVYITDSLSSDLTDFLVNSKVNDNNNIFVYIDITHKCHFAKNKTKSSGHQFVYGILFTEENWNNKDENNTFILYLGKINYCNQIYVFCVLLNSIISKKDESIDVNKAIFSISDEIYTGIRSSICALYMKSGKLEL